MLHFPRKPPRKMNFIHIFIMTQGGKTSRVFFLQLHSSKDMSTTWTSSAGSWGVASPDDTIIFKRINVCGVNNWSLVSWSTLNRFF